MVSLSLRRLLSFLRLRSEETLKLNHRRDAERAEEAQRISNQALPTLTVSLRAGER